MPHFDDVHSFHEKFDLITSAWPGHLTKRKLKERVECMEEELKEFKEACDTQDLAGQADALIDLVYFAIGTAVMMGLPWADLWKDVQRANMTKVRGVTQRGHKVDVCKPEGWVGPMTGDILAGAGYYRDEFADAAGNILEERCIDDAEPLV